MANIAVQGIVVNASTGVGIGGLTVVAYDIEYLCRPVKLGQTTTTNGGYFKISYSPWAYGIERKPDLQVCCFDGVGRLLYESEIIEDIEDETFDMSQIKIPENDITGLFVTLLTGTPQMLSSSNSVAFDIDNEAAWNRLTSMAKAAGHSISTTQLILQVPTLYTVFEQEPKAGTAFTAGLNFPQELVRLSREKRVAVRLLLNSMFPDLTDAGAAEEYFIDEGETTPHRVEVLLCKVPINAAMHAKLFIFDLAEAYLNSSPLIQEYFDGQAHLYEDPRRGKFGFSNVIKLPIHDVSIAIKGPAVKDLYQTFYLLWQNESTTHSGSDGTPLPEPEEVPPVTVQDPNFHQCRIQVVRTLPGERFIGESDGNGLPTIGSVKAVPKGERGILEAYLRAFETAQDFIYLENQYFTERAIIEALILALKRRPDLQLIAVVNLRVDAPLYGPYQDARIKELWEEIENPETRFGIFTLWSENSGVNDSPILIPTYVHSKVGIVDDLWSTVGSANLDGQGLNFSQHTAPISGKPSDSSLVMANWEQYYRAMEVNVVITSENDVNTFSPAVLDLRCRLWAEHLGLDTSTFAPENRPTGGWLSLWKERAQAKLNHLKGTPTSMSSEEVKRICVLQTNKAFKVLGTTNLTRPFDDFLETLGISTERIAQLGLRSTVPDFDFDTGEGWTFGVPYIPSVWV